MKRLLCLALVLCSAASADAAGLGLGRALARRGNVQVNAPGVQVNVNNRSGLVERLLNRNRASVNINLNNGAIRQFNRSSLRVDVGHSYDARSFEVRSYAQPVVYVQPTYAQPVIVQPQPVYVQQPVYSAPALQSQYSAPLVQYIVQPIAYYAAPVIQYATSHCAPAVLAVSSYSSCGSSLRVRVR